MELSNYATQMLLQLNQQRSKGFLCDVVVMVDNALFRAHKSVLAAASSYFKSLVLHDNLIHLDAELVEPAVFQKILDFIYTGKLCEEGLGTEHVQNLSAFLTVANYLQLHDLANMCTSKLESSNTSRKGSKRIQNLPFSDSSKHLVKREAEDTSSDIEVYANMVPPKKRHNGENKFSSGGKQSFGLDLTKKSSSLRAVHNGISSVQEYSQSSVSKTTANAPRSGMERKGSLEKTKSLGVFDGTQEWKRTPSRGRSRRKGINGYMPVTKGGSHVNQNHAGENSQEQPHNEGSNGASPNFVYRQESYLEHTQEDHSYVCIPCGKGFPSSESLNTHVESHTDADVNHDRVKEEGDEDPPTIGPHEDLEVIEKSPAKPYKELDTLRPFPCNICGKMFTQRGTMTRHMRSHLGLKPFACGECGMRFTRQYRLTEHMRVHSGEKPYECHVCGGKFTQQRNLISHMRMHTSPT
ncbi:hypermethylated in cancer 1 like [Silurus asotus]|uniref:Hypermethylated in cancer 2 protein n=1 Tax=Silurus asotus TaxID=30991 RepID=A0AAD5AKI6_SILAS|nr:hypermethylated in cancer 1 like [Silurus asotus]